MLIVAKALTSCKRTAKELPSMEDFIHILQKYRKNKNLGCAKLLYIHMCNNGLETHRVLGNYLVPMLVDCGSASDAHWVFNSLNNRNECSWTSLIHGYIDLGELHLALNVYQEMQEDRVQPSKYTFVALLKACARLKCMERGQEICADVTTEGLDGDLFIGNSLIDMYAKCGSLAEAQKVFDELPVRDVVSWNALMTGLVEHGLGEEALNCFQWMQLEGVAVNEVTCLCILKACGCVGAVDSGREIHALISKQGFETDTTVGNTLLDVLAKCGLLAEGQEVFDKLPVQDVVSWTALIAGYAEHGLGEEALKCFQHMQLNGVSPNAITCVCSLKACGSIEAIHSGREIHGEITKKGFERDPSVGSTLLDMYAKCGFLAEAQLVFEKLPSQNLVSWSALIAGHSKHGLGEEGLQCFKWMQLEGVSPNAITLTCALKACGSIKDLGSGLQIHSEIAKGAHEREKFVGSFLVDMYAKCGSLAEAREVMNKLQVQDVDSWNALIAGYAEFGLGSEGLNCLQEMQLDGMTPDVVSWNTVILGYAEQNESGKAYKVYAQMQEQGLSYDSMTFVSILKACGNTAALETGQKVHVQICSIGGLEDTEVIVATALVDMYGKCGSMLDAQQVFDSMISRDLVTWNALITGYSHQGESELVFYLFEKMKGEGIQPNKVTFLSMLTVCSHVGLADKGQKYFAAMSKDYGITATIKHHNCMVDLFARAGQFDEALVFLKKMPLQPDLVVWNTVLGACQKWGNVELGIHAFERAVRLGEKRAATYVLMSNIFVDGHVGGLGRRSIQSVY